MCTALNLFHVFRLVSCACLLFLSARQPATSSTSARRQPLERSSTMSTASSLPVQEHHGSIAHKLVVATVIAIVLPTVFLALRLLSRAILKVRLYFDDWLIIIAWVSSFVRSSKLFEILHQILDHSSSRLDSTLVVRCVSHLRNTTSSSLSMLSDNSRK